MKKFIKKFFPKMLEKKCKHEFRWEPSYLWDFHSGGDGEIYVRTARKCKHCNNEDVTATRLPDEVTTLLLASKLEIWTMGSERNKRN